MKIKVILSLLLTAIGLGVTNAVLATTDLVIIGEEGGGFEINKPSDIRWIGPGQGGQKITDRPFAQSNIGECRNSEAEFCQATFTLSNNKHYNATLTFRIDQSGGPSSITGNDTKFTDVKCSTYSCIVYLKYPKI